MKVALLGGSFNPIHLGHLQLADELKSIGYSRVVFVPSNRVAHKDTAHYAAADHRLAMVRLCAHAYGFDFSDCEIRRGGVSYSIDTVRVLIDELEPEGRMGLVIGEDLLPGFHQWRKYRKLLDLVDLILAKRGDTRAERDDIPYRRLNNPDFPISSTEIRERISDERPFRFLVPPEVAEYIRREGLYHDSAREQA